MEGPQTRVLADHLNDLLTGRPVSQIVVPEDRWQANVLLLNCVGQVIQRVRSHGKWMFLDFSHGISWVCPLITRSKWGIVSAGAEAGGDPAHATRAKKREPLITVDFRGSRNGSHGPVRAV